MSRLSLLIGCVRVLFLAVGCAAPSDRSSGAGGGDPGGGGEGVGPDAERPGEGEGEGGGPVITEGEGEGPVSEGEGEPGGRPTGAPCDEDDDCAGGVCLRLPGGYCTMLFCEPGGCGDNAVCAEVQEGVDACLANCLNSDECRSGYHCTADSICLPRPDDEPGEGEGEGDGTSPVGGPCREDADCEGPEDQVRCLPEEDGFPDGYCILEGCEEGTCPDGASCIQISMEGDTACLATCEGGCRDGYACDRGAVCMPDEGGEGEGEGDGSPIGGPCTEDLDCADRDATCVTEEHGFPGGYCMLFECGPGDCPAGSECFQISAEGNTACLALCGDGCRRGYYCAQDVACMPEEGGGEGEGEGEGEGDGAPIGGPCVDDGDCADGGATCLSPAQGFPGGYCTILECRQGDCPRGSGCLRISEDGTTACLASCDGGCREGYECEQDIACVPGAGPAEGEGEGDGSPIGGPCDGDADCADRGATCLTPAQGFPGGYCTILECQPGGCPAGSECFQVSQDGLTACLAGCDEGCREGYQCVQDLACMPEEGGEGEGEGVICEDTCGPADDPGAWVGDGECDDGGPGAAYAGCELGTDCTDCGPRGCDDEHPCEDGLVCRNGRCIADMGDVPPGPVPACNDVVPWECDGNERHCGQLVYFEPEEGDGWWNYPLNGETANNQYRSFLRRDLRQLVMYAASSVRCLSEGWDYGNDQPIGLGDMSEADGSIPGTSDGDPGHPQGTHTDGHDIDTAYYQVGQANNILRAVCPHMSGGREQYHCVGEPEFLDVWRTALFIAKFHDSPQLRVIGVDGRVGPVIEEAIDHLCAEGWLDGNPACDNRALAYEVNDTGRGWYHFHHHHMHISLSGRNQVVGVPDASRYAGPDACITVDCRPIQPPE